MTYQEYNQLKAFARVDAIPLCVLWVLTFVCYMVGLTQPGWSLAVFMLVFFTPFFVGSRLRHFRNAHREGTISFLRGWGYVICMFFYAAILFTLVLYAYFTFIDQGYLLSAFQQMMSTPEMVQMAEQMGISSQMTEAMEQMEQMRPIDLSLNVLTTNIMLGIIIGIPIAAIMKQEPKTAQHSQGNTNQ